MYDLFLVYFMVEAIHIIVRFVCNPVITYVKFMREYIWSPVTMHYPFYRW